MSYVCTGAPCRTAARPPTRMNSTPPSVRLRSAVDSLFSFIQLANRQDISDSVFEELQPLSRGKRQHPANQRQIHAIFAVLRPGRGRLVHLLPVRGEDIEFVAFF